MIILSKQQIPDYYPSMYLDGYSPEQILDAAHRSFFTQAAARQAGSDDAAGSEPMGEVSLKVNVKGSVK